MPKLDARPVRCFRLETDPDTGQDVRVEIPSSTSRAPDIASSQPAVVASDAAEQALLSTASESAANDHWGTAASGGAPSDAATEPATYTLAEETSVIEELTGLFSDDDDAVDLSDGDMEALANKLGRAATAAMPLFLRHAAMSDRPLTSLGTIAVVASGSPTTSSLCGANLDGCW